MMAGTTDVTELEALAADLTKAAATIDDAIAPVMEHWALDTKKAMQEAITGSWRGLAPSISYDRAATGRLAYEVGPDKGRGGGPLGNLYYFGSRNTASQGDIEAGAAATQPSAEEWIVKTAEQHTVSP